MWLGGGLGGRRGEGRGVRTGDDGAGVREASLRREGKGWTERAYVKGVWGCRADLIDPPLPQQVAG